jgi:hypothetical protein
VTTGALRVWLDDFDGALDGRLAITARRSVTGAITSARLITKGLVAARHGRVKARIKVPACADRLDPGDQPAPRLEADDEWSRPA